MGVKYTQNRLQDVLRSVNLLARRDVLVGIPAKDAQRFEKGATLNNAQIGYLMEYGSPAQNIPARPSLRPGVESVSDAIADALEEAADAAIDGDTVGITAGLTKAGFIAQNGIRAYITNGPHKPLAPYTLAKRRAKGRTGIKPLIDTGQFRNHITFVIRVRGSNAAA